MPIRTPAYVGNAEQRAAHTMRGMAQPRGCMPSASGHRTYAFHAMPRRHVSTTRAPVYVAPVCAPRMPSSFFSHWYIPSWSFLSAPRVSPVVVRSDECDDCSCAAFTFAFLAIAAISAFFARLLTIRY